LKRLRHLLWGASLLSLFLVTAWFGRAQILTSIAKVWIIDQIPEKADAIFLLGGGEQFRPDKAAQLYHAGVAPLILIPYQRPRTTDLLGLTPESPDLTRRTLIARGVPEKAILIIGVPVTSTWDEAQVATLWVQEHKARNIIVPTDMFHTRRAHWIFNRQLQPIGAQAHTTSALTGDYVPENWWHNEHGLLHFQNEVFKHLVYLWKY